MFGEELRRLVRRGVAELDRDVEVLESLLEAARGARDLFLEVVSSDEDDSESLPEDDCETLSPPPREELETAAPLTVRSVTGYQDHSYVEFEQALLASGKRGTHDLIGMAQVWADLHDGMVLSRDLAVALSSMGLSKSSMTNLPSYLGRKMVASREFEREGRRGSGRYRRVYPLGPARDGDALDWAADDEAAVPSGLSGDGTDSMD